MKLNHRSFVSKLSDGDIRLLRIFCVVTRCGGFAAAESELQLGLPSISRYIKSLEIRLGARLCRRGRVGFSLTEQGHKVYAAGLQLLADIERFEGDIRSMHSDLTGTLNLGVIDTLITDRNLRIPELIRSYKTKYPRVEFKIVTATSNVVEQSVLEGSIHVGIVHARRHVTKLDYRFLFLERCNLYASEQHPLFNRIPSGLRPEEVYRYDFAGFSYLDDSELGAAASLVKTASVDCMEALATLISTGCFIGFLPDHYVQSVWRLKQFRPILPDVFSYAVDIDMVTRSGTSSPLVLALLDHLDSFALRRPQSVRPLKAPSVALEGN
jgi:LysR family transcriptional regulator, transcriptional activator for bauABCD operon